jgi:hypothetical protein
VQGLALAISDVGIRSCVNAVSLNLSNICTKMLRYFDDDNDVTVLLYSKTFVLYYFK